MSSKSRTSLPRPMTMASPMSPTMAVCSPAAMEEYGASWYGGMTSTTKVVLAVIIGVAVVFLLAWLMCPAYRRRDHEDDCDDSHHRKTGSWCMSSGSDDCDDDVRLIVLSPSLSPAGSPAPASAPVRRNYRYKDDCGWSGSSGDDLDRRRRNC